MKTYTSLNLIQQDLKDGSLTCVELVDYYLNNIEKSKHLNAYLEVYADEAKALAREIDKKFANGTAGKLAGMVVATKDVLAFENHHLQAASNILEGYKSQYTGTAVQRLLDEDAIIIGRNNCDEFGMGSSNENSAFGSTLNAQDENRVPGGSSGGSAVAVQADTCLVSLGSDTGGSVRQPAAFCGIFGLKPTYSRISRHGLIAYASSFDCIGILTKSVEDAAITLEVIAGKDDFDSTVSQKEVPVYSQQLEIKGKIKIAYIKETLEAEGLDPKIKQHLEEKLSLLKKAGHEVEAVSLPTLEYILPTYYILTTAESSSNLSRYDGVKFGYRTPTPANLEAMYKKTRSEGFGAEVKRRIMLGTFVLSASYYDAYYNKAQKVRRIIREQTKAILNDFDFILAPTTPTTAFKIGEHTKNPLEMYLADLYTVQASVAGLPAISIPTGSDEEGMPIGLQAVANDFEEGKLLAFSKHLMNLNN
ncbi:Asp-tRNA(Asn)/Glu-tRNA(Gln) amidotransferase subunit GatA [Fulvivirga sp. RKSG066]|uniref:Asp-tRNA(Asn)/Glu-tRNA(Gln) amidotransferase subunit GatA n=1 Tax=Fulvivirga aurantia TaxID=2529383 RepID=UPI0012BCDDBF|nr:Asp-tRNA(Asn)/Glu-tRNA(Gln) amidotransferase subunit GatA [Fulvivirga aurantia]MTI20021.1 Asp-tRNA(Asn)/Glu-tRNA(Gln) amidotransferase subunit GatA [Fulvivirga aurantia]